MVFHNLKNYDGHHLMTKLRNFKDHEIDVIACTLENYITFKLYKPGCSIQMAFMDSFQFLLTSLEKLVKNLEPDEFCILGENFLQNSNFCILIRTGVGATQRLAVQLSFTRIIT